jgi:hypothetical protein
MKSVKVAGNVHSLTSDSVPKGKWFGYYLNAVGGGCQRSEEKGPCYLSKWKAAVSLFWQDRFQYFQFPNCGARKPEATKKWHREFGVSQSIEVSLAGVIIAILR